MRYKDLCPRQKINIIETLRVACLLMRFCGIELDESLAVNYRTPGYVLYLFYMQDVKGIFIRKPKKYSK